MLGGLLLQHFSWHSVFWINVPAVCVTLAAGAVLMPESRNPAAPPLDAPGALLSAGAVTGLVWGVINGQEHGWTAPPSWVLVAGSAMLLAAFLARERRSANPVIDPALFRDRRFTWGTVATPATWPFTRRIRAALLHGLQQVYDSDRDALLAQNTLIVSTPVLRERLWAGQMATQEAILQALGPRADFQARVITAACLAAASTAVLTWVQNNGTPELPDLINQAFETLANCQAS